MSEGTHEVGSSAREGGSDGGPARDPLPRRAHYGGLCPDCRHLLVITSGRGSTFLRCALQRTDPRYPKYPPQPVLSCSGFER